MSVSGHAVQSQARPTRGSPSHVCTDCTETGAHCLRHLRRDWQGFVEVRLNGEPLLYLCPHASLVPCTPIPRAHAYLNDTARSVFTLTLTQERAAHSDRHAHSCAPVSASLSIGAPWMQTGPALPVGCWLPLAPAAAHTLAFLPWQGFARSAAAQLVKHWSVNDAAAFVHSHLEQDTTHLGRRSVHAAAWPYLFGSYTAITSGPWPGERLWSELSGSYDSLAGLFKFLSENHGVAEDVFFAMKRAAEEHNARTGSLGTAEAAGCALVHEMHDERILLGTGSAAASKGVPPNLTFVGTPTAEMRAEVSRCPT